MRTKNEIIEDLFTLLDSIALSGELFANEIKLLDELENEYYIIKSSEK